LAEEVAFVGVDVHKKSYSVCVWTEARGRVARWTQPADPGALLGRLDWIRSQVGHVVYEAGPTGYGLLRALRGRGYSADVVAPSATPKPACPSDKSDRLDAEMLAMLDAKGLLRSIYVPSVEEEADRQVVRRREQVVKDVGRVQRRIKSFLLQHGLVAPEGLGSWSRRGVEALRTLALGAELRLCLDSLLSDYEHGRGQVAAFDARIRAMAGSERYAGEVAAMRQPGGIGPVTAVTVATEMPHPERFKSGEEVASFVGISPSSRRSGQTSKGGPIRKAGNRHLRRVLVEAAWRWAGHDGRAKALYRHLVGETGCAQKAIVGVARHLAILLWRLRVTGETYVPLAVGGEEPAAEPPTES
jgi:transposase